MAIAMLTQTARIPRAHFTVLVRQAIMAMGWTALTLTSVAMRMVVAMQTQTAKTPWARLSALARPGTVEMALIAMI